MAEKKKKKKKKQAEIRPAPPQNDNEAALSPDQQAAELLGPNAAGAKQIAESFFPEGSLGRVEEGRSQEVTDLLGTLQGRAQTAGQRSGEMKDVIARMQAGLAGYNSAENQAFREQAQRGIDTQYKTGLGQLARAQARGGVRGANAAAQVANANRERVGQQKDLEQGLFVKNADEVRSRLESYGNTLRGVEGEEFGRGRAAQSDYTSALTNSRAEELGRQESNLARLAAERGGMADTYFNAIGVGEARQGVDRAYDLGRRSLRVARRAYQ